MINSFTPLPPRDETSGGSLNGKTRGPAIIRDLKSLVGGSTPENLGEILLKALQTNDKNLWNNCLHPDLDLDEKFNSESFHRVRNFLIQEGITKWDLVEFSRVVYQTYTKGLSLADFKLEFLYKNKEFIGALFIPSVKLYEKKYFINNAGIDYNVERK